MSENTVLLLPHQERFLQSRKNFTDIRWHFLLAGYGAGKSRSLAISVLDIVYELDGEKDDGGLYAKIIVGGYTYAHLEQTLMIDLMAYLDASKTPYHEDTKNHILTVGTVQVIFVQLLEPGKIFGQSVYCALCLDGNTKLLTKSVSGDIMYRKLKNIAVGDTVLTRAGWRKVIRSVNQGKHKVIAKAGFIGTPDHKICSLNSSNVELQDITRKTPMFKVSARKVKLWEELNQKVLYLKLTLSTLTEFDTTDTLTVLGMTEAVITGVKAINRFTELYGKKRMAQSHKDVSYTTKTVTLLIMLLKILSACRRANTARTTEKSTVELFKQRLSARLYVMYAEHILKGLQGTDNTMSALDTAGISLNELYSTTSGLLSMFHKYRHAEVLDTKLLVKTVEKYSLLSSRMLDFVLRNVETHILTEQARPASKKGSLSLLPAPFVEKHLSLKDLIVDFVHSVVLTFTGGIRTVYDITVNDCHEFATVGYLSKNCDEIDELPEETMIEAMKSISQRVRQVMPNHRSPFIMAASTAQGMKGFYRLYCHYKKSGIGFVLTRARTQDNWYLPKEYILDLWKNFTETERKVYMEGAFLSVTQGRVIPGFDWDKNFLPDSDMDLELLPGERVYIGQDFNSGYNRGSAWVVRNGVFYCVKYYDFPDQDDAPNTYRYDFPEQDIFWLPDVTIKDQYPHFARALRKNEIHIIHRSKSPLVEDSCFLISKLCLQSRIIITSQAKEVAEAFSTASRGKDNKIPKGVGPNSPIHAIDGARYVCSYVALVHPDFKDIRRGVMSHLASFRAGAAETEERLSAVGYAGAGYTRIEGRAFTER